MPYASYAFEHFSGSLVRPLYVRYWLITDLNEHSDHVRFTPESGHAGCHVG